MRLKSHQLCTSIKHSLPAINGISRLLSGHTILGPIPHLTSSKSHQLASSNEQFFNQRPGTVGGATHLVLCLSPSFATTATHWNGNQSARFFKSLSLFQKSKTTERLVRVVLLLVVTSTTHVHVRVCFKMLWVISSSVFCSKTYKGMTFFYYVAPFTARVRRFYRRVNNKQEKK